MRTGRLTIALVLVGIAAAGCAVESEWDGENDVRQAQVKAGNAQPTFRYFRCNATGWGVDARTRLAPSVPSGTYSITYDVKETWMTTGWDTCTLVETNQRDGWGSMQRFYDKVGSQQMVVPASGPGQGQLALALAGQDYHFNVRYPALGTYTMTIRWADKRFSIERDQGPTSGWVWPVPGQDGRDWVINNYVDLDTSPGLLDYQGGAKTYDGHTGTDIDIPTFRQMDRGQPVVAASAGTVVALGDGNYDRNTTCVGAWNYVTLSTDDGYQVTYGHLKRNSIVVSMGSHVAAGATLAMVGSSGCSTWPHLHFEAYDASGALVDPFLRNLWDNPPPYNVPLSVMDTIVADQEIVSSDGIADPKPNVTSVVRGGWLAVGISAAGGTTGDHLGIEVVDTNGATYQSADIPMPEAARHTIWYFNWILDPSVPTGRWTVRILVNGNVTSYPVQVN